MHYFVTCSLIKFFIQIIVEQKNEIFLSFSLLQIKIELCTSIILIELIIVSKWKQWIFRNKYEWYNIMVIYTNNIILLYLLRFNLRSFLNCFICKKAALQNNNSYTDLPLIQWTKFKIVWKYLVNFYFFFFFLMIIFIAILTISFYLY